MSAIRAANAYVELQLRQSAFAKGLRNAEKSLANSAKKMRKVGGAVLGAGAALAAPFVVGIRAASDMEETMQKFNVVFGAAREDVKAWSDEFANNVGRSRQQIADFLASSQDLFIPLGFDPTKAEELSKVITGLSIDLASFNNKADADVQRDLQAALTGSGEVMKKYGVVLSEAAVKQELVNQGLDPKNASNAQKAMARLNIILAGTTSAQGDAIRSGGSFANQMKRLQGNVTNAFESLGTAILPFVTMIVERVNSITSVVSKWISSNQGLVKVLAVATAAIIGVGAALIGVGGALSVAGFAIGGIVSAIGILTTVVTTTVGVLGTMAAAVGAFIISPIGIAVAVIGTAAAALIAFTETGQSVIAWFTSNFGTLVTIVGETVGGIYNALTAGDLQLAAKIGFTGIRISALEVFNAVTVDFVKFLQGLMQPLTDFIRLWADRFGQIADFFSVGREIGKSKAEVKLMGEAIIVATNSLASIQGFDTSDAQNELRKLTDEASVKGKAARASFSFDKLLGGSGKPELDIDPKSVPKFGQFEIKDIASGQKKFGASTSSAGSFSGAAAGQRFGGSGSPVMRLVNQTKMNAKQQKKQMDQLISIGNEQLKMKKPAPRATV